MCNQQGRSHCSELGAEASLWSKDAPLQKPVWIKEAFHVLTEAIKLTKEGNLQDARFLLENAPDLEMRDWFVIHAQNSGAWRNRAFEIIAPEPVLPLDPVKRFTRFETVIFARDNLRCRYCSSEVIPKRDFEKVQVSLGPKSLPLGKTNSTRSGFYLMFVATLDHVLPWSLGGRTDEPNLVTCCWSCNYGKGKYTVEQIGINDPRGI